MIDLIYFRHRMLNVRRRTRSNKFLAAVLLTFLTIRATVFLYQNFSTFLGAVASQWTELSPSSVNQWLMLVMMLGTLQLFMLFSPPAFDIKPYKVLKVDAKDLVIGNLLVSMLSPVPLIFLIIWLPMLLSWQVDFPEIWSQFSVMYLTIYLVWISVHHAPKRFKLNTLVLVLLSIILFVCISNPVNLALLDTWQLLLVFLITVAIAYISLYYNVLHFDVSGRNKKGAAGAFFNFNDPLLQLEWALITRNKRTRSNLLAGVISIPILVLFMINTSEDIAYLPILVIALILTSFVMLQHGIYMIGWEGSYFDLLLTRFSFHEFFAFKFRFFVITSLVMSLISFVAVLFSTALLPPFLAAVFYNLGVNTFIVLNGSLSNRTKLDLDQSTVFNTAAINGGMVMTSLVIILVPIVLYAILEGVWGEIAAVGVLMSFGIIGLLLHKRIIKSIAKTATKEKYQLSNAFRS